MKSWCLLVFLVVSSLFAEAHRVYFFTNDLSPKNGVISGQVVEAGNNVAVEYATIGLFRKADSTLVDGTITDATGEFSLKRVPDGEYYLTVQFMGYRNVMVNGISISKEEPKLAIGEILLNPSVTSLDEVEIVGEKSVLDYKIDRKVVNVDQHINAGGGTAVDVLENIPSIQTDLEGNVELRGSSDFTVLIDGKPSILTGSDALKQIPAATIDKIEIITNPSAKFDPDGTAGILNIITKKNSLQGFSGIVNLSGGTGPEYSADLLLNYKAKRVSYTFGVDYSKREMKRWRDTYRETYLGDTTSYLTTFDEGIRSRDHLNIKAGIDYKLSDKNTISLEGNYRKMGMENTSETRNTSWLSTGEVPENYLSYDLSETDRSTWQLSISDVHKFNEDGQELTSQLSYNYGNGSTTQTMEQYLVDDTWEPSEQLVLDYKRLNAEENWNLRGDFDYVQPIGENSLLEAGVQFRLDNKDMENLYYDFDTIANDWALDEENSNTYQFTRNIYAAYATYARQFNNFDIKAGLRGEYTSRLLEPGKMEDDYLHKKFDLYPSFYFTYYLPFNQQLQLNYSKRVKRPRGHELNPYTYFTDGFNSFKGNPDLEPEYTHSVELNYQKTFGYSYISVESFYKQTYNKITRLQTLDDDGTLVMTVDNLDNDRRIGVEAMGNIKATDWLLINPSATIYDYRVLGTSGDDEVRQSTNWMARLNLTFKLKTNTRIQINGMYNSPTVTVDGNREGMYFMGIAARQDLFKQKLSVTLNIRDLLDSRRMEFTSGSDYYYTSNEFWREAPMVSLTLSYKLNNYKNMFRKNMSSDSDYDMMDVSF